MSFSTTSEAKVQHLRDLFEGREAIYIEKGALHVKVSNIHLRDTQYISADVEEIPTVGFPTGRYCEVPSPGRWTIGAGLLTRTSDNIWHMGYGGWGLFFSPRIVEGVQNLALQFPDSLDAHQRYKAIWRYLYDHEALEPTEPLWEGTLMYELCEPVTWKTFQRIWERVKKLVRRTRH
jgi:hypothetical protein